MLAMATNESNNDPLLEQIFSAVHLTPVNYTTTSSDSKPENISDSSGHRYSEDEQTAIRQLDDFLMQQNSSTDNLLDSEPSEAELPEEDRSSGTLRSPRSSRTNTDNQGGYDFYDQNNHRKSLGTQSIPEWNSSSEPPRLQGLSNVQDEVYHGRNRSQTYDSVASAAESRFGEYNLSHDYGNNNDSDIDLNHDEVAYHRPSNIKRENTSSRNSSISQSQHKEEPIIDKSKLIEYQKRLIEAKEKERQLNKEIHKYQSQVLSKEFLVRQATENVRKQLNEIHEEKRMNKMSEHRQQPQQQPKPRALSNDIHKIEAPHRNHQPHLPYRDERRKESQELFIQPPPPYNQSQFSSTIRSSSVDIYEEDVPVSITLSRQLENAELIEVVPEFRYLIPKHQHIRLTNGIDKYIIGGEQAKTDDDKSVLLFGPNGSGKTGLINSMINYLYDVKKEHDIRLCINYPYNKEPTKGINVYVFNNTIYPYSITIIDTPGVPNRKGYTKTSTLVKNWFDLELKTSKSLRIDAISVVLRHDEGELGWPLINELAAIKRLLKDDLRTNVMPVTTFGEVLPQPQALRSIVFANIPFISYYKINNAGYMQVPPGQKPLQHSMSYKHSAAELERYFTDLHELVTPLLAVTHYN